MTRQEKLIQLVAGLGSWTPLGESWNSEEARAKYAVKQLAEIEKVCPEDEAPFASVPVLPMDVQVAISDAVARTRIEERVAERERCAKIAEAVPATCHTSRDEVGGICEMVADAIRRGGA